MIGDSISPLKVAIAAVLKADSAFMALVTGVFDGQAPTGQAFNYVVMGHATQIPKNTLGKGGRECTIEFDIYTKGVTGSAAADAIKDQLLRTLVQTTLTLSTTPAQVCSFVDLDNDSDEQMSDGLTYHAFPRLLFRTFEL